jgi:ABC-type amino acid transport substrate-binding protein
MRRLTPFLAVLAALAVLGVTAAAVPPAVAADAPPAATATAASPTLERIKRTGEIRLAYRDGARPFSFRERGQVRGYSAELCLRVASAIQTELGLRELKIAWTAVDAATRIETIATGKADISCGTATVTLERMKSVDFSLPIFVDGGTVLVRSNAKILRLADLKGRKVAVIPGTTSERALKKALETAGAPATVVPVTDARAGMAQLAGGTVDGYAGDRTVLAMLRAGAADSGAYAFIDGDFSVEPYALMLPRNDADFRLAVNRALVALFRSGEIDSIYQRWLGGLGEPSPVLHAMIYLNMLPE